MMMMMTTAIRFVFNNGDMYDGYWESNLMHGRYSCRHTLSVVRVFVRGRYKYSDGGVLETTYVLGDLDEQKTTWQRHLLRQDGRIPPCELSKWLEATVRSLR
eukprot:746719-Hanusia_phi.AAC.3